MGGSTEQTQQVRGGGGRTRVSSPHPACAFLKHLSSVTCDPRPPLTRQ